ncbi:hypothetical protein MTO96_024363 [Rhipicephalus appendiculatus]
MLLTYRSTPHEVTGCCPSELLLGRKLRTALDLLHPDLRTKVLQKQLKQKIRCDQGTRPRVVGHPGDQVFARNFRPGPAWLPAVVTEQRTSSMDVLLEDGRRLTRHLDHICQPHEELSADNQKSGSPVATGLAPSLDVDQRQLTPHRLHDTESRQDPQGRRGEGNGTRCHSTQHSCPASKYQNSTTSIALLTLNNCYIY